MPIMPGCAHATMVPMPNGQSVIMFGCEGKADTFYHLFWNDNDELEWTILSKTMENGRTWPVGIWIPNELANCITGK